MGDKVGGVGPVTVSPAVQGLGLGHQLMQAVIKQGAQLDGIRLVQDSANVLTISLYGARGFQVREPLLALVGEPRESTRQNQLVRPLEPEDIPACEELCAVY